MGLHIAAKVLQMQHTDVHGVYGRAGWAARLKYWLVWLAELRAYAQVRVTRSFPGHTPASSIPAGCMQNAVYRNLETGCRIARGCRMAGVMEDAGSNQIPRSLLAPASRGQRIYIYIYIYKTNI